MPDDPTESPGRRWVDADAFLGLRAEVQDLRLKLADEVRTRRVVVTDVGWPTEQVLQEIERATSISAKDLLLDIQRLVNDTTNFRSHENTDWTGSIGLDAGLDLFPRIKRLLSAGAKSLRDKRVRFGKINYPAAAAFLGSARLGLTYPGSYVVPVLTPVPPPEEDADPEGQGQLLAPTPETRLVVENLMSSLQSIRNVFDEWGPNPNPAAVLETVAVGASFEMFDTLRLLTQPGTRDGLSVSVTWAATVPERQDISANVDFTPTDHVAAEKAAVMLRETHVPSQVVSGRVVELSKQGQEGIGPGQIILEATSGVSTGTRVTVGLDLDDHVRAIRAYESDERLVVVGALLAGRRTHLLNARITSDQLPFPTSQQPEG